MIKEQFIQEVSLCIEKSGLLFVFSEDVDRCSEMAIDDNDRIYISNTVTGYFIKDVSAIKYYEVSDEYIDDNEIIVFFRSGDIIEFIGDGSIKGLINNKQLSDKALLKYLQEASGLVDSFLGFRRTEEALKKLAECADKAELDYITIPEDEHSIGDVFFVGDTLFIDRTVETPYCLKDIERIMCLIDEYECNAVIISFRTGSELKIADNGYLAWINNGLRRITYKDSQIGRFYPYWAKAKRIGTINDEFVIVDGLLLRYNGNNVDVNIPKGVKEISDSCFEDHQIKRVNIPGTIEIIGKDSFRGCKELEKVIMNEGVREIKLGAFMGCESLVELSLPRSLKSIEAYAFFESGICDLKEVPDECVVSKKCFGTDD